MLRNLAHASGAGESARQVCRDRRSFVAGSALLAAMAGGLLLSNLHAQELSHLELLTQIDAVVAQAMADGPIAGVSIGGRPGRARHPPARGWRDPGSADRSVTTGG